MISVTENNAQMPFYQCRMPPHLETIQLLQFTVDFRQPLLAFRDLFRLLLLQCIVKCCEFIIQFQVQYFKEFLFNVSFAYYVDDLLHERTPLF